MSAAHRIEAIIYLLLLVNAAAFAIPGWVTDRVDLDPTRHFARFVCAQSVTAAWWVALLLANDWSLLWWLDFILIAWGFVWIGREHKRLEKARALRRFMESRREANQ